MTYQPLPEDEDVIKIGYPSSSFPNNSIRTSKYTPLTFLPLNLRDQFSKFANIYFLMIIILQMVRPISLTGGIPTNAPTLVVVIFISMVKDLIEDLSRKKEDDRLNSKMVQVFKNGRFESTKSESVRRGDLIRLLQNEQVPADIILLDSSNKSNGNAMIETKNLDGETNFKSKIVPEKFFQIFGREMESCNAIVMSRSIVRVEKANPSLMDFRGTIQVPNSGLIEDLGMKNLILRGSSIQATDYVIGVVIYAGSDTKIIMNSNRPHLKRSYLEEKTDKFIIFISIALVFFCMVGAALYLFWYQTNKYDIQYLELEQESLIKMFFIRFGNWFLIFANFVPISLVVTVDMVKYLQSKLVTGHPSLFSDISQTDCTVQSSNLIDELGKIDFIFSDKTGTLTRNNMIFKSVIVGATSFGNTPNPGRLMRPHVDFGDHIFEANLGNPEIQEFLRALSICHDVAEQNGIFSGASPDEVALVNFAAQYDHYYRSSGTTSGKLVIENGRQVLYEQLLSIEFNSTRKRMSVIVRKPDGRIVLYSKGADSMMLSRSLPVDASFGPQLEVYAEKGLRTLVIARKDFSEEEFQRILSSLERAKLETNPYVKEQQQNEIYEQIERNWTVIGATAVEDRLQENVPEVIADIRKAGVKLWVLTGDKVETALNVAYGCNLMDKDMKIHMITGQIPNETAKEAMRRVRHNILNSPKETHHGLVITSAQISEISSGNIGPQFIDLALMCDSVMCARVSPKQKGEIVGFVMQTLPTMRCLAIGDGANDVSMIMKAHVGVGIKGVEGGEAARVADFSIGEFQVLKRLMFVVGRDSYRKNSILTLYNFYKNILLCMPQFWYAVVYSNFSGVTFYDSYLFQLCNIFYTSLPIILYALWDVELPEFQLMSDPSLYKISTKNLYFNISSFTMWAAIAAVQSFIIAVLCGIIELAPSFDGDFLGFWGYGIFVFAMTQVIANLKVVIFSNSFYFLNIITIVLSIAFFFISFLIIDKLSFNMHYGLFYALFNTPNFYLITALILILCFFVDYLWELAQKILFFKSINIVSTYDQLSNNEQKQFVNFLRASMSMPGGEPAVMGQSAQLHQSLKDVLSAVEPRSQNIPLHSTLQQF